MDGASIEGKGETARPRRSEIAFFLGLAVCPCSVVFLWQRGGASDFLPIPRRHKDTIYSRLHSWQKGHLLTALGDILSSIARRAGLQRAMLIEPDVNSRVGSPRQFTQRFKLLQAQQRRMRRVGFSRLLTLA
jgi:hypothetical protein